MAENQDRLNPQITSIEIGKRNLRSITLYPMSLSDEKYFGDVVQKALQKYFEQEIGNNDEKIVGFVEFVLKLIEKNLIKILGLITDEKDPKQLFDDMTNFQLSELLNSIYEVNFKQPSKNAESLLEKGEELVSFEEAITTVLERYPQYDLSHFYRRSYREGGLTRGQFLTLYEHTQKREEARMRFLVHIHGFAENEDATIESQSVQSVKSSKPLQQQSGFMFKAPSEYEHMTQEEREAETKRMMGMHKQCVSGLKIKEFGVN